MSNEKNDIELNRMLQTSQTMRDLKIVPDVLCGTPQQILDVKYPEKKKMIALGDKVTSKQARDEPEIKWKVANGKYYTICLVDPDSPSPKDPYYKEWLNWLVVNIPGNDIHQGEVLAKYSGLAPKIGTDYHRRVFVVLEQEDYKSFKCFKKIKDDLDERRINFYVRKFARENKCKNVVGVNAFLSK